MSLNGRIDRAEKALGIGGGCLGLPACQAFRLPRLVVLGTALDGSEQVLETAPEACSWCDKQPATVTREYRNVDVLLALGVAA